MRADLMLLEAYQAARSRDVSCPVTAFAGSRERVGHSSSHRWSTFTGSAFRQRIFPGNHFYLADAGAALAAEIVRDLHCAAGAARPQLTGSEDGRLFA